MSNNTLTVNLVTDASGNVDEAASQAAFTSALTAHVAERETQNDLIADGVKSLFDQYLGKSISMPTVASMVTQKLGAPPESFKTISDRVLNYVRANSQGDNSLLVVTKGKGGGCARRSDIASK
jgi:hypothetical protein